MVLIFFMSNLQSAFSYFAPNIECTILKSYEKVKFMEIKNFPSKYQSINYSPKTEKLIIAGAFVKGIKPIITFKTDEIEKISITSGVNYLELELLGKPISRNGYLSLNGKKIALLTCH